MRQLAKNWSPCIAGLILRIFPLRTWLAALVIRCCEALRRDDGVVDLHLKAHACAKAPQPVDYAVACHGPSGYGIPVGSDSLLGTCDRNSPGGSGKSARVEIVGNVHQLRPGPLRGGEIADDWGRMDRCDRSDPRQSDDQRPEKHHGGRTGCVHQRGNGAANVAETNKMTRAHRWRERQRPKTGATDKIRGWGERFCPRRIVSPDPCLLRLSAMGGSRRFRVLSAEGMGRMPMPPRNRFSERLLQRCDVLRPMRGREGDAQAGRSTRHGGIADRGDGETALL